VADGTFRSRTADCLPGLRLLRDVNAARFAGAMVWGETVPDGTDESVRIEKAERALDEYDREHGWSRELGTADALARLKFSVPMEAGRDE